MIILLIFIQTYFYLVLGKKFMLELTAYKNNSKYNISLLLIPFSSTFFFRKKLSSYLKFLYVELLALTAALIFSTKTYSEFSSDDYSTLDKLIWWLFFNIVIISILYLASFDVINFAIPEIVLKRLLLFVLGANTVIGLINYIHYRIEGEQLFNLLSLGRLHILFGALFLFTIFYLVIKLTKEKGMGAGDLDLALITGLSLGWPSSFSFFLTTIITGTILSVAYSFYIGRYKNVIVPFVPFMFLGYVIALAVGEQMFDLLIL